MNKNSENIFLDVQNLKIFFEKTVALLFLMLAVWGTHEPTIRHLGFPIFKKKTKSFVAHKKLICAPSDQKQLTLMFKTFALTVLVTCHNRLTTFLMQLFGSLVTSEFLLVSNDIEHLIQIFG
jgi:hypothetical protein